MTRDLLTCVCMWSHNHVTPYHYTQVACTVGKIELRFKPLFLKLKVWCPKKQKINFLGGCGKKSFLRPDIKQQQQRGGEFFLRQSLSILSQMSRRFILKKFGHFKVTIAHFYFSRVFLLQQPRGPSAKLSHRGWIRKMMRKDQMLPRLRPSHHHHHH